MQIIAEPSILYFGTPVVLIASSNADGSPNLAPMSSAFWLGWRCMLGLGAASQTAQNLQRSRECTLNLPCDGLVRQVDRLALTTGRDPVPPYKAARGYRHVADKFAHAGFTADTSATIAPPRVRECPVQMEAVVEGMHELAQDSGTLRGAVLAFEVRIQRVWLDDALLMEGRPDHVDPDRWRPLIMSFQKFYGLAPGPLHPSMLASIPERSYRSPDVDRAREALPLTAASTA